LHKYARFIAFLPECDPARWCARKSICAARRFLGPEGFSGAGIKGFNQPNPISDIGYAVDNYGCGIPAVGVTLVRIDIEVVLVKCGSSPRDLKVTHVIEVDAIQRRVFGAANIAAIGLPLTILRAVAGAGKGTGRGLLCCIYWVSAESGDTDGDVALSVVADCSPQASSSAAIAGRVRSFAWDGLVMGDAPFLVFYPILTKIRAVEKSIYEAPGNKGC
jgi:hypothetical protein